MTVRVLFLSLVLAGLSAAWAEPLQAGGLKLNLSTPFSPAKSLGGGAVSLTSPARSPQPRYELVLHILSAKEAGAISGHADLLQYEKTTYLGLSKPAEWSSENIILGQSAECGGQSFTIPRPGVATSTVVHAKDGRWVFLALRAYEPVEKGEPERIWRELCQSLSL